MRILNLQAENLRRLKAVDITPGKRNVIEITGANEQGKSSVLDAIAWALEGANAFKGHRPVRDGERRAWVELDLGDFVVTRTFSKAAADDVAATTKLEVVAKDGSRYREPQSVIDGFIGRFAFDPMAWARLKPKEQADELKALVKNFDFGAAEAANRADFEERTFINREALRKTSAAQEIDAGLPHEDDESEEVDVKVLSAEIAAAHAKNAETSKRRTARQQTSDRVQEIRDEIERLDLEATALQQKLDAAQALPEIINTSAMQAKLEAGLASSETAGKRRERRTLLDEAKALANKSTALTDAINKRKAEMVEAIADAKLPVKGLTLDEDAGVMLGGVPFVDASTAQQIKASMAIAMAMNPDLRVVRIREGSLLDAKSKETIEEMAAAKEFQVWIESVEESGKVGFYLEAGAIKAVDGKPSAATKKAAK